VLPEEQQWPFPHSCAPGATRSHGWLCQPFLPQLGCPLTHTRSRKRIFSWSLWNKQSTCFEHLPGISGCPCYNPGWSLIATVLQHTGTCYQPTEEVEAQRLSCRMNTCCLACMSVHMCESVCVCGYTCLHVYDGYLCFSVQICAFPCMCL
jgi:hypothetical protein